jgi:HEAT repeat protein
MAFALAAAGRPTLDPLFEALADRDLADQALEYLVEIGPQHASAIAARLGDQNPAVREQIAIALGFIGGQDAVAALAAAANDASPEVRTAASVAQLRMKQRAVRGSTRS